MGSLSNGDDEADYARQRAPTVGKVDCMLAPRRQCQCEYIPRLARKVMRWSATKEEGGRLRRDGR